MFPPILIHKLITVHYESCVPPTHTYIQKKLIEPHLNLAQVSGITELDQISDCRKH